MKVKNLALMVMLTIAFAIPFARMRTTAEASPPIPTAFYLVSSQSSDEFKVQKIVKNLVIIKAISYHNIHDGGSVDGTITLNIVMIVDIQTGEAYYSGSFVITTTSGDTIHGRVNAKITNFFVPNYVTQGTFVGGGYMNIRGTLSTPNGKDGPLVWQGISW